LRAGAPPGSAPERRLAQRFAQAGLRASNGERADAASAGRIALGNYRARILLAQLRLARGEREAAVAELRALLAWMDDNERFGLHHHPRAQALMLLGDTDRALAELAAAYDEDRDYRQWWYVLGRDPTWAPVRADPRFRAISDAARAHVRRERATLDALRLDGKVPPRGTGGARRGAAEPAVLARHD
jgi:predicted Zn-dependent protease